MEILKTYKYVITKGRRVVVFSPSIEHVCFKELPSGIRSAGFVDIYKDGDGIKFKCYGESRSLGGIKSLGEKDDLLFKISGKINAW